MQRYPLRKKDNKPTTAGEISPDFRNIERDLAVKMNHKLSVHQ